MDNLAKLRRIPIIEDIKPIRLTPELRAILGRKHAKYAAQNSPHVFVYGIRYRSQGHLVSGFIVEPRKGKGKLPCIVWNRGGSGDFGTLKQGMMFGGGISGLARAGYIVFMSQYSGNGGSEGKDELGGSEVQDILNLHKIIRSYRRADAKRIGIFGASRGGMMTFLTLARVRWAKAAVLQAPMSDAFRLLSYRGGMEWKRHYSHFFKPSKAALIARSPALWVRKLSKRVPILLQHGTADWRVRAADSIALADKLLAAKIPFRMTLYEGADHYLSEARDEARAEAIAWFDRFVKRREKLPDLSMHGA
jgi:dipeptidyl aminopeptidase/acylaminoacyl peptidase